MNNPMQLMQMFNQIKGSNNPMGMMSQMFGNNPQFKMAQQMTQGKSPAEIQQVINNVCQQKGINQDQLKQMAQQMGIKF